MFLQVMPKSPAESRSASRLHLHMGFQGGAGLIYFFFRELLKNLPALWKARRDHRKALRQHLKDVASSASEEA